MLYKKLIEKKERLSVIGLGYVGMPIAIAFGKSLNVVGFDINEEKIKKYKLGIDETKEVGDEEIKKSKVIFTSEESELNKCKFHIVAVPTPINEDKSPNLNPIIGASKILGRNLKSGSIIVYESTVYPGVTEEVCVPILEAESGLTYGKDFFVGYSPERINPGDKVHRLENIVKIVSGMDNYTLENIAKTYEIIVKAGVYRAESIKVAEAAKVIENSQRDINIAFMNELSIIFNKMGIDSKEVLNAAKTKWNFLEFTPGLVGGHCIGVDPYYLTYKAEKLGYHSQVILSGRRINDNMGKYVAENTVKNLIKANRHINGAKVGILGFTFKENCPDIRNTKVIDIVNELLEYGIEPILTDPLASKEELKSEYGLELKELHELKGLDALILAVPHREYKKLNLLEIESFFKEAEDSFEEIAATSQFISKKVVIDVKGIINKNELLKNGFLYWRL